MHNQTNCQSPQKQAQIRKRGTSFDAQFDAFEFEPWAKTEISKPLSGNPRRRSIEITRRRMIARDLAQIQSARRAAKQAVHAGKTRPAGIVSPARKGAPRRHAVKKAGNSSGSSGDDSGGDPASPVRHLAGRFTHRSSTQIKPDNTPIADALARLQRRFPHLSLSLSNITNRHQAIDVIRELSGCYDDQPGFRG